ncbi:hypothetical protein AAFF_G00361490 [Aldrovandia affinis]|uniref:Reverse transcriptase/retrotransposon-derived protein RNase H-like domain-containing protein n=1 Tax=Aldrovandia affinis TaxID=143900 RepID=A0AAD7SI87_9TELE|nr:hypothetical protein AAFF_G00361490 [Aldrovandia affinis]
MVAARVIKPSDSPWAAPAVLAFNVLQTALITAPVLAYPDANWPFTLDTDASNVGIGAVLSQQSDNGDQVRTATIASMGTDSESFNWYHGKQGFTTPDTGNVCVEISHGG